MRNKVRKERKFVSWAVYSFFTIFVLVGLFLMSPAITGNVIGANIEGDYATAGMILAFIGLIGLFSYVKIADAKNRDS